MSADEDGWWFSTRERGKKQPTETKNSRAIRNHKKDSTRYKCHYGTTRWEQSTSSSSPPLQSLIYLQVHINCIPISSALWLLFCTGIRKISHITAPNSKIQFSLTCGYLHNLEEYIYKFTVVYLQKKWWISVCTQLWSAICCRQPDTQVTLTPHSLLRAIPDCARYAGLIKEAVDSSRLPRPINMCGCGCLEVTHHHHWLGEPTIFNFIHTYTINCLNIIIHMHWKFFDDANFHKISTNIRTAFSVLCANKYSFVWIKTYNWSKLSKIFTPLRCSNCLLKLAILQLK